MLNEAVHNKLSTAKAGWNFFLLNISIPFIGLALLRFFLNSEKKEREGKGERGKKKGSASRAV